MRILTAAVAAIFLLPLAAQAAPSQSLSMPGLSQPVEIIQDRWGVSHIYAKTENDLFFAQGYNAARDRLFELEMWRRQATGTVSEILGPSELKRDIGNRLFQYRGDMKQELNWYHPHSEAIIESFARGVNAYHRPDRARSRFADAGVQDAGHQARQMDAGHRGVALQWTGAATWTMR